MRINFWGATDDVTGSMTFLNFPEGKILIDCGLAQGTPETEKINSIPLPFSPSEIKAVIITHAHLDHSGYLPRLVKNGFRGTVFCTPPTAKIMRIILLDSAKLNEDGFYDVEDVQKTLQLVKTHEWNEHFEVLGASVSFIPAGHILGASSVVLKIEGKKIIFSGDLGRSDDPILPAFKPCPEADVVVMESTYGGKNRSGNMEKELHSFLATVARESRVGIIASFAVARAQTLLTLINEFYERHPEEKVRVVMDSPMMKEANKVYQQYSHLTKLKEKVFAALDDIDAIDFQKEWTSLKKKSGPLIILSSSGMLTGGRIARHLYNWHDDNRAILFLPGYQGKGTPGRSILEGNRQLLGPQGEVFDWAGDVWSSEAFSSHADQKQLMEWAVTNNKASKVFLLHGEPNSKIALQDKLNASGLTQVEIPMRGSIYEF
jgi:metallo-beta-lactamase family protein